MTFRLSMKHGRGVSSPNAPVARAILACHRRINRGMLSAARTRCMYKEAAYHGAHSHLMTCAESTNNREM